MFLKIGFPELVVAIQENNIKDISENMSSDAWLAFDVYPSPLCIFGYVGRMRKLGF
jgi:hypothetical protein